MYKGDQCDKPVFRPLSARGMVGTVESIIEDTSSNFYTLRLGPLPISSASSMYTWCKTCSAKSKKQLEEATIKKFNERSCKTYFPLHIFHAAPGLGAAKDTFPA